MTDPYADWSASDFHSRRTSGLGCPGAEGGAHYFAFLGTTPDIRSCIDCGELEFAPASSDAGAS